MDMTSFKTWALLGAAGGAGFGLFGATLIYVLFAVSLYGSVALGDTVRFAVANGVTWGVLGLFAGVFLWVIFRVRRPAEET
jgi:hypothetical protein